MRTRIIREDPDGVYPSCIRIEDTEDSGYQICIDITGPCRTGHVSLSVVWGLR